jgi:hypothetical protein
MFYPTHKQIPTNLKRISNHLNMDECESSAPKKLFAIFRIEVKC